MTRHDVTGQPLATRTGHTEAHLEAHRTLCQCETEGQGRTLFQKPVLTERSSGRDNQWSKALAK